MQITSASFKSEDNEKKLVLLFEMKDKTQKWINISESNEKFSKAKELTLKYMSLDSSIEQSNVAEELLLLTDTEYRIRTLLESDTSGIFTMKGKEIYHNGDVLNPYLSLHISQMFNVNSVPRDVKSWNAFAKFVENLQNNVSEEVREQLFSWMSVTQSIHGGFTITEDGCFMAYKGCPVVKDGVSYSGQSGNASVLKNGQVTDYTKEQIPNELGTVVMMPRKEVTADPRIECGPGLHVSTLSFAQMYSRDTYVYAAKVNPKDVVSIVSQKVRVSRYELADKVQEPFSASLYEETSKNNAKTSEKDTSMGNHTETKVTVNDSAQLTNQQRGEIFAGLDSIGIERFERGRALRWISKAIDRTIESRNDLTVAEANTVLSKIAEAIESAKA